jgi:hypothetical protein
MQSAILPTVTQEVRAFLVAQGASLEPWSGLDETTLELYQLLARRRGDPSFWPPLARLLRSVVDAALDPDRSTRLAAPEAELLRSWDIERLVDGLRAALPAPEGVGVEEGEPAIPGAVARYLSRASSAVLGGFLLLGLAASGGCHHDDAHRGETAGGAAPIRGPADAAPAAVAPRPREASTDRAVAAGCGLPDGSLLRDAIEKSRLAEAKKQVLCGCFAKLSASWSDGLAELFRTQPPNVVARVLEIMVGICEDPAALAKPFSASKDRLVLPQKPPPRPVPVYKGVSFPAR